MPATKKPPVAPPQANILGFDPNNINPNDIRNIAENADNLIKIISNIKESHSGVQELKKPQHSISPSRKFSPVNRKKSPIIDSLSKPVLKDRKKNQNANDKPYRNNTISSASIATNAQKNNFNRHSMGSSRSAKLNEDIEEVDAERHFSGISEEEEEVEAQEVHMEVRDSDLAPLEEFEKNKRKN